MHTNNLLYYPFSPFYELSPYSSMFPFFQPQIAYNSSYPNYQLPQLQPVEIITAALDASQKLQNSLKIAQKVQKKLQKNKIHASTPRYFKGKISNNPAKPSKDQKPLVIQQKQGRNANSNLLRMFFRRLQNKIQDNLQQIQYVIKKYQMKITLQEFTEWIKTNKVDYKNYIRVPSIKKFFVGHTFVHQHTKIMRILFKDFIDRESISCYLTSKKMRKQAMSHNYNSLRSIFKDIFTHKG